MAMAVSRLISELRPPRAAWVFVDEFQVRAGKKIADFATGAY